MTFALKQAEPERVVALCGKRDFYGRLHLNATGRPVFTLTLRPDEDPLAAAKKLVKLYGQGEIAQ